MPPALEAAAGGLQELERVALGVDLEHAVVVVREGVDRGAHEHAAVPLPAPLAERALADDRDGVLADGAVGAARARRNLEHARRRLRDAVDGAVGRDDAAVPVRRKYVTVSAARYRHRVPGRGLAM